MIIKTLNNIAIKDLAFACLVVDFTFNGRSPRIIFAKQFDSTYVHLGILGRACRFFEIWFNIPLKTFLKIFSYFP